MDWTIEQSDVMFNVASDAGVGVGGTVPIAAKPALADVQQTEGFPRGGRVADIKALGTHR
jgi:hypothetical protein